MSCCSLRRPICRRFSKSPGLQAVPFVGRVAIAYFIDAIREDIYLVSGEHTAVVQKEVDALVTCCKDRELCLSIDDDAKPKEYQHRGTDLGMSRSRSIPVIESER